jgi:hypothetical protein
MNEGKFCTKCNEYKLYNEYYKAKKNPTGIKSSCKQCLKPIKQNHYKNNKEKYKKAFQEFMIRNPTYKEKNIIKN